MLKSSGSLATPGFITYTILLEIIYTFYILQETKRPIYALLNAPWPQNTHLIVFNTNINGLNYPQIWIFLYSGGVHIECDQHGRQGGGLKFFHILFYSSWSKVFVAKAPTFYPEVHFSSTKGPDYDCLVRYQFKTELRRVFDLILK